MIKALLGESLGNNQVICRLCPHQCRIDEGKAGICRVRKNIKGELFSLNSDKIVAMHLDPIEKKPLYHFLPGSRSFSIAAMGCNLSCRFCQNYSISMVGNEGDIQGEKVTPEEIVALARKNRAQSISYTYTEPTVFFELVMETAKLAHSVGIKNVLVSNGYMTEKVLSLLAPFIDGANIDLKSFNDQFYKKYCSARLQPVLETISALKALGVWLEVTTLLIPGLNDDHNEIQDLIRFLLNLDKNIPWHVSRFFPQYLLQEIESTPPSSIHSFLQLGADLGLLFPYGGNIADSAWSHTRCPSCRETLIKRFGYHVENIGMKSGACQFCGVPIAGIWE